MVTQHTPGPWRWDKIVSDNGAPLIVGKRRDGERDVAIVLYSGGSDDPDVHANARLIAAAPDLLKALQMMVSPKKWPNKDGVPLYDYALTTINKAT